MLCRAKICALITLTGALTAAAAPLNPELKNTTFQPGGSSSLTSKATVIKPAATGIWSRLHLWSGVKVQKLAPPPASAPAQVEVNGFVFRKTAEAVAPKPTVQPAGGGR